MHFIAKNQYFKYLKMLLSFKVGSRVELRWMWNRGGVELKGIVVLN